MRAVETIKNIWKIEDLRQRILTTILFVVVYRLGSFVVIPGIDPASLSALKDQTAGGLLKDCLLRPLLRPLIWPVLLSEDCRNKRLA